MAELKPVWSREYGGFIDNDDNVWTWDKYHDDHWDVIHPDGSHTNVYPKGSPSASVEPNAGEVRGPDNFNRRR